jgi:capsular exopolysaccharide synthesis family protein
MGDQVSRPGQRGAANAYEQAASYGAYPGVPSYYGGGGGLDFKHSFMQLLQVLRRGKWIIAAVFAATFLAVAVLTFMMDAEYRASTLMMVDNEAGTQDPLSFGFVQAAGVDASRTTQALILQESIEIAERTWLRLAESGKIPGTDRDLTFLAAREELVSALDGVEPSATDWANYIQREYIRIIPEGDARSSAIRIVAISPDPVEAAALANVYAEEYRVLSGEGSLERIRQSRAFLEDQIATTQADLSGIESEITAYQRSEGAVSLDAASQLTVAQMASLQAELSSALVEQKMVESSLAAMENQLRDIEPRLAGNVSAGLDEELTATRDKITGLEAILEPIYAKNPTLRQEPSSEPHVMEIVTLLDQYRNRMRELSEQYVSGSIAPEGDATATGGESFAYASQLKNQISTERISHTALDSKIGELRRTIGRQSGLLDQLPGKSVRLQQMDRVRVSTESKLITLQKNLQDVRLAEESRVGFVKIIRPALVPTAPDKPDRPRNMMLGAILGLMLGLGAAIVRFWMDAKVYSPDDITSKGITLMGAVPDMGPLIKEDFGDRKTHLRDGRNISTGVNTLLNPSSPVAEAYRRLYVNIQFSVPDKVVQTVLISSPEAEVGKSTTSLNLAVTASRARRRTLIVDADFHRPSVARYLDLRNDVDVPALVKTVGESTGDGSSALDITRLETGFENLYALAPLRPIPEHAELLGSFEFRRLLQEFREIFDIIVIDTPPVLLTADAATLSTQADATVLVASAGSTDLAALLHCVRELEDIGANFLGVVVNRFDPSNEVGYKHTYKYRYQEYNKYYRGGKREDLATV